MKVLILSDLNWHTHLQSMTAEEVISFEESRLSLDRYQRIKRYLEIILVEKVDIVLFAGDVTGDGFCGHGFHYAFSLLLTLLERRRIPSFFISGNHDEPEYYDKVIELTKDYQYVREISNQSIEIAGLKILGINYDCSKSKRSLKTFIKKQEEGQYDLLVAHSPLKRRIRLFDLPCQYIITGHYDRKLCMHRDTVFIALDNDSEAVSYAIIEKNVGRRDLVHFKVKENAQTIYRFTEETYQLLEGNRTNTLVLNEQRTLNLDQIEAAPINQLVTDKGDYLYFKYLRGANYVKSLNTLYKTKQKIPLSTQDLDLAQVEDLPIIDTYKISESMIVDYLGKYK